LASTSDSPLPIVILFPEVVFNRKKFIKKVRDKVKTHGYCSIVVSEGVKGANGKFLSDQGLTDAFGHAQLGGVAPVIANMIKADLGLKYHWGVADYLQRAARHIASKVDVDQAYALGESAGKPCNPRSKRCDAHHRAFIRYPLPLENKAAHPYPEWQMSRKKCRKNSSARMDLE
jgi:6-phosphofructokinase